MNQLFSVLYTIRVLLTVFHSFSDILFGDCVLLSSIHRSLHETHDTRQHDIDTRRRRSPPFLLTAALSTLAIHSIFIRVTPNNTVRVISRVSSIDGSTGYHHNLTTMAPPAALPPLPFNPARVRSYILRIPLFTRLVLLATIAFWVLELQTLWSVVKWGSLAPDEIGFGSSMFPFLFFFFPF